LEEIDLYNIGANGERFGMRWPAGSDILWEKGSSAYPKQKDKLERAEQLPPSAH
jgi:hypothetical protein